MTSRNIYLNGDVALARQRGYDIVQPKYDGWWCKAVCKPIVTEFYSETGRLFGDCVPTLPGCVLVGEFMRGTQWAQNSERKGKYYIYDLWAIYDEPMTEESYKTRYQLLRKLHLPPFFHLVPCHNIADFDTVWDYYVEQNGYEGVVFRKSTGRLDEAIIRHKKTVTVDGTVIALHEGNGKHAGRLGALQVVLSNGVQVRVGGGFNDAERIAIWSEPMKYVGRVCEIEGYTVFDSGSVRHPNFLRWRDDKLSTPSSEPNE